MDDVASLCRCCAPAASPDVSLLFPLISLFAARVADCALSPTDRSALALRLLSSGGMQHKACRELLCRRLCPPYASELIAREANDRFLRSGGARAVISLRIRQCPLVLTTSDAALVARELFDRSVALGDLPPGLAAYVALHDTHGTMERVRCEVLRDPALRSWQTLWRGGTLAFAESMCWQRLRSTLIRPLCGGKEENTVKEEKEEKEENEEKEEDGAAVFAVCVMLRLIRDAVAGRGGTKETAAGEGKEETAEETTIPDALRIALQWTETQDSHNTVRHINTEAADDTQGGDGDGEVYAQGHETAVRAIHGILVTLYCSACGPAAQCLRATLDTTSHATDIALDMRALLAPDPVSLAAAAVLHTPVALLHVADTVWSLLEQYAAQEPLGAEEKKREEKDPATRLMRAIRRRLLALLLSRTVLAPPLPSPRRTLCLSRHGAKESPAVTAAEEAATALCTALAAFASGELRDPFGPAPAARILLTAPPHMQEVRRYAETGPEFGKALLHTLLSALLLRQCVALRDGKALCGGVLWRLRRWVRFVGAGAMGQCGPVVRALLPECLRRIERAAAEAQADEATAETLRHIGDVMRAVL